MTANDIEHKSDFNSEKWKPDLSILPDNWELKRLKHVSQVIPSNVDKKSHDDEVDIKLCNYTEVYNNNIIDESFDFMDATAADSEIKRFELKEGDILFTKDSEDWSDIGVPAFISEDLPGVLCGYHLFLSRPNKELVNPEFLFWALKSRYVAFQFEGAATGVTRYGLSTRDVANAWIPCPPYNEQEKIATCLNSYTEKIDKTIQKQREIRDLLEEKRRAVITHSATGEFNHEYEKEDSGIPWLDRIPKHWDVIPLKYLAKVQTGIAKGRNHDGDDLEEVPYLRVANVQDGYLELDNVKKLELTKEEVDRYALQDGDVLMNEGGDYDKLGRGTVWRGQIDPCVHQNHVFCVRPHDRENSEWISMLTQSDYLKHYFMMNAKQTTNLASISASNISKAPIVWPPKEEREKILNYINDELSNIERIRTHFRQVAKLLEEKRQSFVTQGVTGQINLTD